MLAVPNVKDSKPFAVLTAPRDERPRLDADAFGDCRAVVIDRLSCSIELLGYLHAGEAGCQQLADLPLSGSYGQNRIRELADISDQADFTDFTTVEGCAPSSDRGDVHVKGLGLSRVHAAEDSGLADCRVLGVQGLPGRQAGNSLDRKWWVGIGGVKDAAGRVIKDQDCFAGGCSGFRHDSLSRFVISAVENIGDRTEKHFSFYRRMRDRTGPRIARPHGCVFFSLEPRHEEGIALEFVRSDVFSPKP